MPPLKGADYASQNWIVNERFSLIYNHLTPRYYITPNYLFKANPTLLMNNSEGNIYACYRSNKWRHQRYP